MKKTIKSLTFLGLLLSFFILGSMSVLGSSVSVTIKSGGNGKAGASGEETQSFREYKDTNGAQLLINAVADEGYFFSHWDVEPEVCARFVADLKKAGTTFTFSERDVILTAVFEKINDGIIISTGGLRAPRILAGIYPESAVDPSIRTIPVAITEGNAGSWRGDENLLLQLNEGVKIRAVEFVRSSNLFLNYASFRPFILENKEGVRPRYVYGNSQATAEITSDGRGLKLSQNFTATGDSPIRLELVFYVSVSPDYAGDITLEGRFESGSSFAKIGEAQQSISVEYNKSQVFPESENFISYNFTVTENVTGALKKADDSAIFEISGMSFNNGEIEYKILKGNISIDKIEARDGKIYISVKGESTDESAIEILRASVSKQDNTAIGEYPLLINGKVCANNDFRQGVVAKDGMFALGQVSIVPDFVEITDNVNLKNVQQAGLFPDSNLFITGNTITEADGAAYFKDGFLMAPVRFVAQCFNKQVSWNGNDNSVTLAEGNRRSYIYLGKDHYIKDGIWVSYRLTPPENTDGTIYMPLHILGQLLDCSAVVDNNGTYWLTKE